MRRVAAALLSILLLLPSRAFATTLYFCKMSGRVGTACCCKGGSRAVLEVPSRSDRPDAVERTDCCDRRDLAANGNRSAVSSDIDLGSIERATLFATLPLAQWLAIGAIDATQNPRARAPPIRRAPAFILYRAYLS